MLGTPADGYATASDVETNLFGRLNAIYGAPGREIDQRAYSAPIGFIED
jgi:Flp pilus assembly secretin CpaC